MSRTHNGNGGRNGNGAGQGRGRIFNDSPPPIIDSSIARQFDRLPPHSIEAEMCCIGSLMLTGNDSKARASILTSVAEDDFYQADHQILYRAIAALHKRVGVVDALLLREEMIRLGLYEEIGGKEYLASLINTVPAWVHGPHYGKIVARLAQRRRVIALSNDMLRDMYAPHLDDDDTEQQIRQRAGELWELLRRGTTTDIHSVGDLAREAMEKREEGNEQAEDLRTGVASIDENFLGIFSLGAYTIVGGRPSMGKSTFVRWVLQRLAQQGHRCGLVSVEERRKKIGRNYVASASSIDNTKLRGQNLTPEEWEAVEAAVQSLQEVPIFVTDSALTLPEVMAAIERLVTQHKCDVIALDHIHLLSLPGGNRYRQMAENRTRELTEISNGLKQAFKRLHVCGIVAAQLSRPDKVRIPKPPTLQDLRECGGLEEHCDSALLLHRTDYYRRNLPDFVPDNLCKVVIAKQRDGQVGDCILQAQLRYQRFAEQPAGAAPPPLNDGQASMWYDDPSDEEEGGAA